jgi:hypothetical protein
MSWYPDMGHESMVASGDHVRAIGWLSSDHPYTRGTVLAEFVERLRDFVRLANESADALYFCMFLGVHTCEFCGGTRDSRNFGVPAEDVLFVAPAMVAHYVEQHGYAPPPEFIVAVLASPLPGTPKYYSVVRMFREIHQREAENYRWVEELVARKQF